MYYCGSSKTLGNVTREGTSRGRILSLFWVLFSSLCVSICFQDLFTYHAADLHEKTGVFREGLILFLKYILTLWLTGIYILWKELKSQEFRCLAIFSWIWRYPVKGWVTNVFLNSKQETLVKTVTVYSVWWMKLQWSKPDFMICSTIFWLKLCVILSHLQIM